MRKSGARCWHEPGQIFPIKIFVGPDGKHLLPGQAQLAGKRHSARVHAHQIINRQAGGFVGQKGVVNFARIAPKRQMASRTHKGGVTGHGGVVGAMKLAYQSANGRVFVRFGVGARLRFLVCRLHHRVGFMVAVAAIDRAQYRKRFAMFANLGRCSQTKAPGILVWMVPKGRGFREGDRAWDPRCRSG